MKALLLLFFFTLSGIVSGQTNAVSTKSNCGDYLASIDETHNLEIPPQRIDSIIYLGDQCVIEVSSIGRGAYHVKRDTICDHPLFIENGFDEEKLKKLYARSVKFIGFKNGQRNLNVTPQKKEKIGQIWILIAALGAAVLFIFGRTFSVTSHNR